MGAREIILTHETTYDASTLPKLCAQQFRVCGTMRPVARSEKQYPRNLHVPYDKAESSVADVHVCPVEFLGRGDAGLGLFIASVA